MTIDKRPSPTESLRKNLFHDFPSIKSFERLSVGLKASIDNSNRLISDTKVLINKGSYSSAKFLLTTAKEELAKTLILSDLCKLDIKKHENITKRLCSAFYNHVSKHAYYETVNHKDITSMDDFKIVWNNATQKYWPSSYESGELDMPHATYFDRELPLYIDFITFDNQWFIPSDDLQELCFENPLKECFGKSTLTDVEKIITKYEEEKINGLLEPYVLKLINESTKEHFINESFIFERLDMMFDKTATMIHANLDISKNIFLSSSIHYRCPLYIFA